MKWIQLCNRKETGKEGNDKDVENDTEVLNKVTPNRFRNVCYMFYSKCISGV